MSDDLPPLKRIPPTYEELEVIAKKLDLPAPEKSRWGPNWFECAVCGLRVTDKSARVLPGHLDSPLCSVDCVRANRLLRGAGNRSSVAEKGPRERP